MHAIHARGACGAGLASVALLAVGCAAPADVRQASADVASAMTELRGAHQAFRERFVVELEATRRLVGDAVVAQAVADRIDDLATQEANGDLMAISEAIADERQASRELVERIMAIDAPASAGASAADVVDRVLADRSRSLRAAAAALEARERTASAQALQRRADDLEGGDRVPRDDLVVLVELQMTKQSVRAGSDDLDRYLRLMELVHAHVHAWIATDAAVRGAAVADLIDRHAALLGLEVP